MSQTLPLSTLSRVIILPLPYPTLTHTTISGLLYYPIRIIIRVINNTKNSHSDRNLDMNNNPNPLTVTVTLTLTLTLTLTPTPLP